MPSRKEKQIQQDEEDKKELDQLYKLNENLKNYDNEICVLRFKIQEMERKKIKEIREHFPEIWSTGIFVYNNAFLKASLRHDCPRKYEKKSSTSIRDDALLRMLEISNEFIKKNKD